MRCPSTFVKFSEIAALMLLSAATSLGCSNSAVTTPSTVGAALTSDGLFGSTLSAVSWAANPSTGPLAAPTQLTAFVVGTHVTLTWISNGQDPDAFEIEVGSA